MKEIKLKETQLVEVKVAPVRVRALDAVLTKDEFYRLLQASQDEKDRLILALGVIGLRAGEISKINRSWLDLSNKIISIPSVYAKRKHSRRVPYGNIEIVSKIITDYFVFNNELGMTRQAIWHRVKRLGKRAGLLKPLTPHGLRATGATWFAEAGWSVQALQEHFGWDAIETAKHYIEKTGRAAIETMKELGSKVL